MKVEASKCNEAPYAVELEIGAASSIVLTRREAFSLYIQLEKLLQL